MVLKMPPKHLYNLIKSSVWEEVESPCPRAMETMVARKSQSDLTVCVCVFEDSNCSSTDHVGSCFKNETRLALAKHRLEPRSNNFPQLSWKGS